MPPKLEAFIELISSLLEDVTLPKHERLEYSKLKRFLENFALAVIDGLTLEESPISLARSLFVQIYRMSLTRSRRAVFLEKADAIEREASKNPYTISLYLDETELREIADIVESEMFTRYRYGIADEDRPLERIHEQLKSLLHKLHYS